MDSEIKQYNYTYQSTIEFDKFIRKNLLKSNTIIDAGCGKGGTLSHYVRKYKHINAFGLDYRKENIDISKYYFKKYGLTSRAKFKKVNLLKKINSKDLKSPDGIISEKAFCTFKNIEKPLGNLIDLKPKWLAINSLFYDGKMDVLIHIRDRGSKFVDLKDDNPDGDFNIFSLENIKNFLKKKKYKITKVKPFFPKKEIKKIGKNRGTFTINTELNKFTCFSGPVYLPWQFILIEKI